MTSDSPRPENQSYEVDDAPARRAITLIDLTDLADDHSVAGIDDLCARAQTHDTAAVCFWPEHVSRCVAKLSGSGVRVATVVNFPTVEEPIGEVLATTRAALDAGADDIDVAESVMGSGWATPATFRFGASGLLDALLEVLDGSEPSSNTDPNGY